MDRQRLLAALPLSPLDIGNFLETAAMSATFEFSRQPGGDDLLSCGRLELGIGRGKGNW